MPINASPAVDTALSPNDHGSGLARPFRRGGAAGCLEISEEVRAACGNLGVSDFEGHVRARWVVLEQSMQSNPG